MYFKFLFKKKKKIEEVMKKKMKNNIHSLTHTHTTLCRMKMRLMDHERQCIAFSLF